MSSDAIVTAGRAGADRDAVTEIRAWWRSVHPPASLGKRLEPVYFVGITIAILGPFVYGTASSALADVAAQRAVAQWGPAIVLVALLALARWGAVQGPVVFSVPDVAHLLGAPLRRADLALRPLLRSLLIAVAGGVVVGAIALVGVAGHHRGLPVARGVGFGVAVIAVAMLGVAGASLVEGSPRIDRATRVATWPIVALAIALVVVSGSSDSARDVVLWSGPWGWAIQPVLASQDHWPLAVALLSALTAAALVIALRRRGACSTERHMLRAQARSGAIASLYSMNARFVGRSLAAVGRRPGSTRGIALRPPRRPGLAIAWRDAVAALGTPQRLGEALVLTLGGAIVCLLNADHPAAVAGGALAIYLGASRLLEPLRSETDTPDRVRVLLREPMGQVLAQHALVPAVLAFSAALVAVAGVAAAGALPSHGGTVAALLILATIPIALCAALSSRRGGQLSDSVMSFAATDQSGFGGILIVAWIMAFPVLAVALGTLAVAVPAAHGTKAVPQLAIGLLIAAFALDRGLRWERFAP
jgi:hypothetical protein